MSSAFHIIALSIILLVKKKHFKLTRSLLYSEKYITVKTFTVLYVAGISAYAEPAHLDSTRPE